MQGLWNNPGRLVPLAFLAVIALGTVLLMLPVARAGAGAAPFVVALFTATSAASVTGLAVVDTASYWSGFGQAVIFGVLQVGGFGIMSAATLLALLLSRRLSLSRQLVVQAEAKGIALGDVKEVLRLVLGVMLVVQAVVAAVLTAHFLARGEPLGSALWHAVFHAAAAFTNAGFTTYPGGITTFAGDPTMLFALMAAVVIGGLGLPVLHDLRHARLQVAHWSLHTKLTLFGTAVLLVAGAVGTLVFEWSNPGTLGPMAPADRVMNALFHSVMTRSGGMNTFDTGAIGSESLLMTYALMLIGGGSAGTAGGIKISTFLILGLAVWSELRGQRDVVAFGRRVSAEVQREALTVVLLAVMIVFLSVFALQELSDLPLRRLVFEVISAFGNVGLSMGVTDKLPDGGLYILCVLMFIGRIGTITLATALALRGRSAEYRYPEERPIVG